MKLHASPEEMEQLSQRLLSFFGDFGILKRLDEQLAMSGVKASKVIYFSELTGAPDSLAEQEPDYWDYYTDIRCALPRDTRLYRTLCHLGLSRWTIRWICAAQALMLLRFDPTKPPSFLRSANPTPLLTPAPRIERRKYLLDKTKGEKQDRFAHNLKVANRSFFVVEPLSRGLREPQGERSVPLGGSKGALPPSPGVQGPGGPW